jgi:hypothetical protein
MKKERSFTESITLTHNVTFSPKHASQANAGSISYPVIAAINF